MRRPLEELKAREALYFLGDDASGEGLSVREAYESALEALMGHSLAGGSETILPYAETYEAMEDFREEARPEASTSGAA